MYKNPNYSSSDLDLQGESTLKAPGTRFHVIDSNFSLPCSIIVVPPVIITIEGCQWMLLMGSSFLFFSLQIRI